MNGFRDSMEVVDFPSIQNSGIRYTLDGSETR